MSTVSHGWDWPTNSKRAHYFGTDRRALCGKWMVFAIVSYTPPEDDECSTCKKRLPAFLKQTQAASGPKQDIPEVPK